MRYAWLIALGCCLAFRFAAPAARAGDVAPPPPLTLPGLGDDDDHIPLPLPSESPGSFGATPAPAATAPSTVPPLGAPAPALPALPMPALPTSSAAPIGGAPGLGGLPMPTAQAVPVGAGAEPSESAAKGRVRAGGGFVNLRAGPGEEFEIITRLATGAPLNLYAKSGNWYKINYPADQDVSIRASDVTWQEPYEIPQTGVPGVVNKADADLHVRAWDRGTVVGKAALNLPVTVVGKRDLWLKILPPPTARAYISADYVTVDTPAVAIAADTAPAVNPELAPAGADGAGGRKAKLTAEQAKAVNLYNQAITERLEAEERARKEEYTRVLEAWSKRRTALDELDAAVNLIDAQAEAKRLSGEVRIDPNFKRPYVYDPSTTGFTGWVEYIGRFGNRPAAFRLVKGGETVFLLRSAKFKLEDYNFKRVWVNGFSEPTPGAEANVFIVTDLRVLGEPPDALKNAPVRFTHPDTAPVPSAPGQTTLAAGPVEVYQSGAVTVTEPLPAVIGEAMPMDPSVVPMGRTGMGPTVRYDETTQTTTATETIYAPVVVTTPATAPVTVYSPVVIEETSTTTTAAPRMDGLPETIGSPATPAPAAASPAPSAEGPVVYDR